MDQGGICQCGGGGDKRVAIGQTLVRGAAEFNRFQRDRFIHWTNPIHRLPVLRPNAFKLIRRAPRIERRKQFQSRQGAQLHYRTGIVEKLPDCFGTRFVEKMGE